MDGSAFARGTGRVVAVALLAGVATAAVAQEIPVTVRLNFPLSAASSHKGDLINAEIQSPDALKGDAIQGSVTNVNKSGLEFTFTTIRHGGTSVAISATIQGVTNSKGQPDMDDQAHALKTSNGGAQAAGGSKGGSRIGGLIGARIGVPVPSGGDSGNSSPSASAMQISAQGSGLELGSGSVLTISAKSTSGPDLAGITPVAPASTVASAPAAGPATATPQQTAGMQPAAGGSGSAQPELKATKIEFVPGERTVFFEDFSDMAEDEPPPHWKVRNGTVELRTGGNIRELYSEKGVDLTSGSFEIPVNFTFELDWTGEGQTSWKLVDKSGASPITFVVRGEPSGQDANIQVDGPEGGLGSGGIKVDTSKPVHFALWAQQGRVRAYLNGERLVDANQVKFGPMDHIIASIGGYRPNGLRQIRIAESAPDFSTVINASGKYISHGINFDTDSERLKPESAAMLKQVAAALTKNPNLKLEIDGYTDSVGKADHNLDLSKRRAQAVKTVLVAQFGVDADRLTSNGFGADNPIGSNDTPDGRAGNRRVEFLKK